MLTLANSKAEKNPQKFSCEICDYNTCNKKDFNKHLQTKKHLANFLGTNLEKIPLSSFVCDCGKSYKHKTSLSKHKKSCNFYDLSKNTITPTSKTINDSKNNYENSEDKTDYKIMFLQLLDENKEFKELLIKQQEHIGELIPKVGNNNNVNNINNVNQKFNINIFLNEKCKDAININDFIKNIEISLEQLDYSKNNGLAAGLSNAIIQNMSKFSLYERPLHCTDVKREILYIKDNDVWEKDNNKEKLKQVIKNVSDKQFRSIKKWTDENPDFQENERKQEYYLRTLTTVGKDPASVDDKVIKKICANTYIKNSPNDD
jgi:hypothetical protein